MTMRGIFLLSLAVFAGCGDTHNHASLFDGATSSMPDLSTPVLDVLDQGEELNIGNSQDIPSANYSEDSTGTPVSTGIQGQGVPKLVLMADGSSQLGKIITISTGARQLKSLPLNRAAPVVGILEFGSGGVLHRVEFDIPQGGLVFDGEIVEQIQGGTVISFPASAFKLFARNDSVAFALNSDDSPIGNLTWGAIVGQTNDLVSLMKVEAFAAYNPRPSLGQVRLTVPFVRQSAPGIPLSFTYRIPQYAKRMILRRNPLGVAVQISFLARSQNLVYDIFTIPAGVNSPIFDIPQQADVVFVDTLGANIQDCFGDFEIQL
jgi:hypothetical protein